MFFWQCTVLSTWLLVVITAYDVTYADQQDVRLDPLFERLHATTDEAEAMILEQQIWHIWFESDNPLVRDLLGSGLAAMAQGDYPIALERFDQLVEEAPEFAEGWNKRATVHYQMGNLEASVRDIQRTLDLEPRHFGALSGLGLIYERLEEPKTALRSFEAALAIHPHLDQAQRRVDQLRDQLAGERT